MTQNLRGSSQVQKVGDSWSNFLYKKSDHLRHCQCLIAGFQFHSQLQYCEIVSLALSSPFCGQGCYLELDLLSALMSF